MEFKNQYFNDQELAMLFQAFGKKLFIRPNKDDIYSLAHDDDGGCTFYFRSDFYEKLKEEIIAAYEQGKFAQSNANDEWIKLKTNFLNAISVNDLEENNLSDYFEKVGQYWM